MVTCETEDAIFNREYLAREYDPCVQIPDWSRLSRYLHKYGTLGIADPIPGVADEELPPSVARGLEEIGSLVSHKKPLMKIYKHETTLWDQLIMTAPWLISVQFFDDNNNTIEIADASAIILHADRESLYQMIGPGVGWR